ncbi:MAG TPA: hypothetical protein DCZ76_04070 [Treponema sp.]|nr:hypothetical protein [Treponema sp.]
MKNIDEQFEFRKLNALYFFQKQIIREKRNREKKNILYTNYFQAAFNYLVKQDYSKARESCKSLKKSCFKWLLYLEFEYYCSVFNISLPSDEDIALSFGINTKRLKKFIKKVQEKLPTNRFVEKSYNEFIEFKNQEENYKKLPIKNIAVCATMSAGKSTFVNALLGLDVLPARNEATTAKITSVYDKDKAKTLLGFVNKNKKIEEECLDANLSIIDGWNGSSKVTRIFLQGDLDGIGNNGIIVAMHDTPGTNNSGDEAHHNVTMSFLTSQKLDALIFVANATQLETTDEYTLLKEIFDKVVKPNNLPVIFVMNKADCIDTEKESLEIIISNYKKYLTEIGFPPPKVFTVSSKAARLLKMVLSGKETNFSEAECDIFPSIVKKFTKRLVFDNSDDSNKNDFQIVVDDEHYNSSVIQTALIHTGIKKIEKEIEMIVKQEDNKWQISN